MEKDVIVCTNCGRVHAVEKECLCKYETEKKWRVENVKKKVKKVRNLYWLLLLFVITSCGPSFYVVSTERRDTSYSNDSVMVDEVYTKTVYRKR